MERIGFLITGNEILQGKTRDTNSVFMAKSLRSRGVEPNLIIFCGDSLDDITRSLHFLAQQCDSIVVTGGLGPTIDDITALAVAKLFHRDLVFLSEAWDICVSFFRRQGRDQIPDSNRKQATLPHDARIIPNLHGAAAGFVVHDILDGCDIRVFCLPGVPHEMEPMFDGFVLPELSETSHIRLSRTWQIFMQGESVIQQKLEPLEKEIRLRFPDCSVSYLAHHGHVAWSLSAPVDSVEREKFLNFLEDRVDFALKEAFGPYVLFQSERKLAEFLVEEMSRKNLLFACAESCTGGLIAHEVTSISGASQMFQGGAVTYSNESKADILGVDMRDIERYGAVSPQDAWAMASGARRVFSADVAISTTGVAGPRGGTSYHPVGMVIFGLSLSLQRVSGAQTLLEKLERLGWTSIASRDFRSTESESIVEFFAERQFGSALSREAIQHRSLSFALGTVIALLEDLS